MSSLPDLPKNLEILTLDSLSRLNKKTNIRFVNIILDLIINISGLKEAQNILKVNYLRVEYALTQISELNIYFNAINNRIDSKQDIAKLIKQYRILIIEIQRLFRNAEPFGFKITQEDINFISSLHLNYAKYFDDAVPISEINTEELSIINPVNYTNNLEFRWRKYSSTQNEIENKQEASTDKIKDGSYFIKKVEAMASVRIITIQGWNSETKERQSNTHRITLSLAAYRLFYESIKKGLNDKRFVEITFVDMADIFESDTAKLSFHKTELYEGVTVELLNQMEFYLDNQVRFE